MPNAYRFSESLLDFDARELRRDGVVVVVPARVFACLQYLLEHRERAVSRDELAMAIFARDNVSDAQLSQIILRARRAVGDDGQEQRVIRTVPSFGFRWVAEVTPVARTLNTPDKENGFYIARMNLDLNSDDPDFPALMLANYIFGEGGLQSRLMDRIRQKDGLSYGGGSDVSPGTLDRAGSFTINAIAAPQNLAKLDAAVRAELATLKNSR